ncbi:MAG: aminoacyl-tRNA hydrolase [Dehalococcoidales bacterium]|nr:aminoacyl-tRNA hydrolase [Dehalococcoidales bacterium]
MKLVVGLGNPGKQYEKNRHNVGFMAIDVFANKHDIGLSVKKKKALFGKGRFNGEEVILLKPQTFMNLSGEAVLYLASFLKIKSEDIIVVADDSDLPLGMIRIRKNGSSGGHNGIKSLIYSLKTSNFPRVRIGIGRPPEDSRVELSDYVLQDFTEEEFKVIRSILDDVADALYIIITSSIDQAMNKYNRKIIMD